MQPNTTAITIEAYDLEGGKVNCYDTNTHYHTVSTKLLEAAYKAAGMHLVEVCEKPRWYSAQRHHESDFTRDAIRSFWDWIDDAGNDEKVCGLLTKIINGQQARRFDGLAALDAIFSLNDAPAGIANIRRTMSNLQAVVGSPRSLQTNTAA